MRSALQYVMSEYELHERQHATLVSELRTAQALRADVDAKAKAVFAAEALPAALAAMRTAGLTAQLLDNAESTARRLEGELVEARKEISAGHAREARLRAQFAKQRVTSGLLDRVLARAAAGVGHEAGLVAEALAEEVEMVPPGMEVEVPSQSGMCQGGGSFTRK